MPPSRTSSSSSRSRSRARSSSVCSRASTSPVGPRDRRGHRLRPVRPRHAEVDGRSRSWRSSDWPSCSSSRPGDRLPALRGQTLRLPAIGYAISFAIAIAVALALRAGGLRVAAARGDHPVRHVARRDRAGARGRRRDRLHVRPAHHRERIDRRLRRDHPALDLLLGRGGHRRDAAADRRDRGRRPSPSLRCAAPMSRAIREDLLRLQDTTAQIRVRGAIVLFVGFAALADKLGLVAILGTFIAGAIVSLADRDQVMTHPGFAQARIDRLRLLHSRLLRDQRRALRPRRAPRGVEPRDAAGLPGGAARRPRHPGAPLPARARRPAHDHRGDPAGTSLPFIVAATAIGMDLHLIPTPPAAPR